MKLIIIGAGVMGSILVQALAKLGGLKLVITDKNAGKLKKIKNQKSKIKIDTDNIEAIKNADAIILAVKPQSFAELAQELKGKISQSCLVVSIMAGVPIGKIKNGLRAKKVVRAMPNLGARVGKSMTVWTASKEVNKKEKDFVKKLFKSIGVELYMKSEKMIDKATAVSGSGPGFFFFIVKAWLEAVKKLGFSKQEAEKLLFATIDGANTLLQKENNPTELKRQVASKGGTTEVGLKIMKKYAVDEMWNKALRKAEKRAKELAS